MCHTGIQKKIHVYLWILSLKAICSPWLTSPRTSSVHTAASSLAGRTSFWSAFVYSVFVYSVFEKVYGRISCRNWQRPSGWLLISSSAGLTDFVVRNCNSIVSWVFQASRSQCCKIGFSQRIDITNGMEKVIFPLNIKSLLTAVAIIDRLCHGG